MRSGEPSRISLRKRWISLTLRARLKWLAGVIHIAQMLCTVWNFNTLNSNSFQFLRGIDMESDNMKKALIAMSGGVDSSVAAYLMKEHGYDCIGVTMKLFQNEDAGVSRKKAAVLWMMWRMQGA